MESQINEFIEYLRYEKNYSEYTIKNYNIDLEQFSLFCKAQNIKNLSNVDYQFIRKYLNVSIKYGKLLENCKKRALFQMK